MRSRPKTLAEDVGRSGSKRTNGAGKRADKAVACEQRRAVAVGDAVGELRVLQRQKHADVAGGRIQRSDERDKKQRPEILNQRESDPGGHHQDGSCNQERAAGEMVRNEPNGQRERR